MTPVGSDRSASSPDTAAGLRAEPRIAALAPSEPSLRPAHAPLPQAFEVRCADIHAGGCEQALRAPRPGDVVALACEHGKLVHGFTAVWHSAEQACRDRRSGDVATGLTVQPRSAPRRNSNASQGSPCRRRPATRRDASVAVAMTDLLPRSVDHATASGARPDDSRWPTRSASLISRQVRASERSPARARGGPR
jgi:hypothetical protein